MNQTRTRLAIIVLALFVPVSSAIADSESPQRTKTTTSPGGEYLFVMLGSADVEASMHDVWNEKWAESIRKVRSKYAKSGMYHNDGSSNALWTVDWYANEVDLSADGIYLVRRGPWASGPDEEALSFFAKGKLLKSYKIGQLVDLPVLLPRSASHFFWEADGSMDDKNKSYRLRTLHGERYRFDIATGEIASSFRPLRWLPLALVVIIICIVIVVRWRRNQRMQNKSWMSTARLLSNLSPNPPQ